jgi:hypothetical protein
MFSFETIEYPKFYLPQIFSAQHIVSPSPKLLQVLVSSVVLHLPLWRICDLLGIRWNYLKTIICSLRPIIATDTQVSAVCLPQTSFPGEVYPWATRDVALRYIRKMVKNQNFSEMDKSVVPIIQTVNFVHHLDRYTLSVNISFLIRLSPPCPELYRELWSISSPLIWSPAKSGELLIYHVSKWLEVRHKNLCE